MYLFIYLFCKNNVTGDYSRLGGWLAKLRDLKPLSVLIDEHFGFGRRAARGKAFFPFFPAAGTAPVLQWRQPRELVDDKNMLSCFESEVIVASTFSFQNSYHSQCSYRGLLSKDQTAS